MQLAGLRPTRSRCRPFWAGSTPPTRWSTRSAWRWRTPARADGGDRDLLHHDAAAGGGVRRLHGPGAAAPSAAVRRTTNSDWSRSPNRQVSVRLPKSACARHRSAAGYVTLRAMVPHRVTVVLACLAVCVASAPPVLADPEFRRVVGRNQLLRPKVRSRRGRPAHRPWRDSVGRARDNENARRLDADDFLEGRDAAAGTAADHRVVVARLRGGRYVRGHAGRSGGAAWRARGRLSDRLRHRHEHVERRHVGGHRGHDELPGDSGPIGGLPETFCRFRQSPLPVQ